MLVMVLAKTKKVNNIRVTTNKYTIAVTILFFVAATAASALYVKQKDLQTTLNTERLNGEKLLSEKLMLEKKILELGKRLQDINIQTAANDKTL